MKDNKMLKLKSKVRTIFISMSLMVLSVQNVFANQTNPPGLSTKIQDSIIFTGTRDMIKDLTTAGMVLAPFIGGGLWVFFAVRKGAADEMDQKKWQTRMNVVLIATIAAELGSVIINLIASYYGIKNQALMMIQSMFC